ncbi:uncharacterized protein LOC130645596 isoform X2 [Hydractinia symbiolongicarpus]|uniref:uncharacterized protein LOC130645596 isoform X2 n=1 Tax=Hydractinia symbiolongicarpus TaxID=13093 RepID=UPI00254FF128|nr:uncharacterized protein LOC130645596 isoform X2 [Hydractinia symbiolongicarpus]
MTADFGQLKTNSIPLEAQLAIANYEKTHAEYKQKFCGINLLFAEWKKESKEFEELGEAAWSIFREDNSLIIPREFQDSKSVPLVSTENIDKLKEQSEILDEIVLDSNKSIEAINESLHGEKLNKSKLQLIKDGVQTSFSLFSETTSSFVDTFIKSPEHNCVSIQTSFISINDTTVFDELSMNDTSTIHSMVVPKTPFNSYHNRVERTGTESLLKSTSLDSDAATCFVDNLETPSFDDDITNQNRTFTKSSQVIQASNSKDQSTPPALKQLFSSGQMTVDKTRGTSNLHELTNSISVMDSSENNSEFINPSDTGIDMQIVKKTYEDYQEYELDFVNPNDTNRSCCQRLIQNVPFPQRQLRSNTAVQKFNVKLLEQAEQRYNELNEQGDCKTFGNVNFEPAEIVDSTAPLEISGEDMLTAQAVVTTKAPYETNDVDNVVATDDVVDSVIANDAVGGHIEALDIADKYQDMEEQRSQSLAKLRNGSGDIDFHISPAREGSVVEVLSDVNPINNEDDGLKSLKQDAKIERRRRKTPVKPKRKKKRMRIAMPTSYKERRKFMVDCKYTFHSHQTKRQSLRNPATEKQSKIYQIKRSAALNKIDVQTMKGSPSSFEEVDINSNNVISLSTLMKNKRNRRVSIQVNVNGLKENISVTREGFTLSAEDAEDSRECAECSREMSGRVESLGVEDVLCQNCICVLKQRERTFSNRTLHRKRSIEQSLLIKTLLGKQDKVKSVSELLDKTEQHSEDDESKTDKADVIEIVQKGGRPTRSCVRRKQKYQDQKQPLPQQQKTKQKQPNGEQRQSKQHWKQLKQQQPLPEQQQQQQSIFSENITNNTANNANILERKLKSRRVTKTSKTCNPLVAKAEQLNKDLSSSEVQTRLPLNEKTSASVATRNTDSKNKTTLRQVKRNLRSNCQLEKSSDNVEATFVDKGVIPTLESSVEQKQSRQLKRQHNKPKKDALQPSTRDLKTRLTRSRLNKKPLETAVEESIIVNNSFIVNEDKKKTSRSTRKGGVSSDVQIKDRSVLEVSPNNPESDILVPFRLSVVMETDENSVETMRNIHGSGAKLYFVDDVDVMPPIQGAKQDFPNTVSSSEPSRRAGLRFRKRKSLGNHSLLKKNRQRCSLSVTSTTQKNIKKGKSKRKHLAYQSSRKSFNKGNKSSIKEKSKNVQSRAEPEEIEKVEKSNGKKSNVKLNPASTTNTDIVFLSEDPIKHVLTAQSVLKKKQTNGKTFTKSSHKWNGEVVLNLPADFKDVDRKKTPHSVDIENKENKSGDVTDNLNTLHDTVIENVKTPVSKKFRRLASRLNRDKNLSQVAKQVEKDETSLPKPFALKKVTETDRLTMGPPLEPVTKKSKKVNNDISRLSLQSSNSSRLVGESTVSYLGRKKKSLFNKRNNMMKTPSRSAPMNSTIVDGDGRKSIGGMGVMFAADLSKIGQPVNRSETSAMSHTNMSHVSNVTYGMPSSLAKYLNQFDQALAFTKKK